MCLSVTGIGRGGIRSLGVLLEEVWELRCGSRGGDGKSEGFLHGLVVVKIERRRMKERLKVVMIY